MIIEVNAVRMQMMWSDDRRFETNRIEFTLISEHVVRTGMDGTVELLRNARVYETTWRTR